MKFITFLRINTVILAIIAVTFLLPIFVAIYYKEFFVLPSFIIPMVSSWILAIVIYFIGRKKPMKLSSRSSFVVVAFAWINSSLLGCLPLLLSGCVPSLTDAFFESVSGYTTTGATIISNLEILPRSINLWRCQMHWLGGMGIVALTVALFPLLGVGGFQLVKAETTGPEKGKVTAKMTSTAKALWLIYFVLTIIQTVLLMFSGMDFVDALSHTFSTLGTGGFSSRNASVGSYNSASIDWICTIFMFLAGINFSLFFYLLTGKLSDIKENSEFKAYIGIMISIILLITFINIPYYKTFWNSLRFSAFQTSSIMTTTGFVTADYTLWSPTAQFLLFFLYFIGGCSGSTGGGIKVIRWVILGKQVSNELQRMIHPHGVFSVRINNRPGRKDVVFSVAVFITVYLALVFITTFIGCIANLDLFSSFTGALSIVGNVGPAFGKLGPTSNYAFIPDFLKWWYSFAMLAGRLELYTMIIYFFPSWWKK